MQLICPMLKKYAMPMLPGFVVVIAIAISMRCFHYSLIRSATIAAAAGFLVGLLVWAVVVAKGKNKK